MSLVSGVNSIVAGCVAIPQHGFFLTEMPAQYQLKSFWGVNKSFYRSWSNVTLDWVCPSPPAQVHMRFYEDFNDPSVIDPVIEVQGYLATCALAPAGSGTSLWLWMATLVMGSSNTNYWNVDRVHVQNFKTNVGSIGLIRYPLVPP